MKEKRVLSLALAAALALPLSIPAGAAGGSSFSDVSDRNTAVNADVLRLMGVVDGVGSNRFNPSANLTRAEFCTMVVKFLQKGDQVAMNATRTIFSDVTSRHWALGYVNLASSLTVGGGGSSGSSDGSGDTSAPAAALISGVGNGRFDPDAKISLAQAATILIRVLGYQTQQVGAVWPESYLNLAASIGLTDGVSAGAYSPITRAQAAQLFVNALSCKTGDGSDYYKSLGSAKSDVVMLAVNVESEDGSVARGAIRTSGGTYLPKADNVTPTGLQGRRGTLVTNDKQEIVSFVPDDSTATTVTLSADAQAAYLKGTDGKQYTISGSTPVYTASKSDGESYSSAHTSLYAGSQVTLFSQRGKVVSVYVSGGAVSSDGDAVVVMGPASAATFHKLTGGVENFSIQKNRQTIGLSGIKPYDVVTYDDLSNTLIVSDLRLTCVLENASPNFKAPEKLTALGHEFEVLDSAWDSTDEFGLGSHVSLLLTADGKVAGFAKPSADTASTAIGTVTASSAKIFLPNGGTLDLSCTISNGDKLEGQLVTIASGEREKANATILPSRRVSGPFLVDDMKLDGYTVSNGVRVYEQTNRGSMSQVSLYSLRGTTIPALSVETYHLNSSGMIDYIVLKDVTGEAYSYGILVRSTYTSTERIPVDENDESKGFYVDIPNSDKKYWCTYLVERDSSGNPIWDYNKNEPKWKYKVITGLTLMSHAPVTFADTTGYSGKQGAFIGVSIGKSSNNENTIKEIRELTEIKNVKSSDFFEKDGTYYVSVGNKTYTVSDNVECCKLVGGSRYDKNDFYSQDTGAERLNACRVSHQNMTIYIDPVGQQVRIVVGN